mgnify:CR=1 FL=1
MSAGASRTTTWGKKAWTLKQERLVGSTCKWRMPHISWAEANHAFIPMFQGGTRPCLHGPQRAVTNHRLEVARRTARDWKLDDFCFLYWNINNIGLQCWISFCCTTTWISQKCTLIPSLWGLPPLHPHPIHWTRNGTVPWLTTIFFLLSLSSLGPESPRSKEYSSGGIYLDSQNTWLQNPVRLPTSCAA